eukprot:8747000-Ditylum_brightwellii.AAC.1
MGGVYREKGIYISREYREVVYVGHITSVAFVQGQNDLTAKRGLMVVGFYSPPLLNLIPNRRTDGPDGRGADETDRGSSGEGKI